MNREAGERGTEQTIDECISRLHEHIFLGLRRAYSDFVVG